LYGTTGSLDFATVAENFNYGSLSILGLSFLLVGFAFKISAVPFHFWTADTYEGSPVAVTAFLSVVSKGAAFFIFITILYKVFGAVYEKWIHALVLLSAITMTIGNLFAMRQSNMKRFLAFSSITQAGYILIAVASGTSESMASVLYFLLIYIFSNVGAFTVVSIIGDKTGKDDIDDYKGLYKTNPKLSIALMIALLSLAGVPPTAGFFGKLFLLTSGASKGLIVLLVIASLNMVISLYYYLKVVKVMFVDKNENPIENISSHISAKVVLMICMAGILVIGFVSCVFEYIHSLSFGL
jgi:NADH-quinone oxidoreductase subunit N